MFICAWLLLAILYWPAAKAGFVADYTGWLDQMQRYGFWDNINRTNYQGQSLYQLTQFITWIVYKAFGTQPILWHLLFITLHAINAGMLYRLSTKLLQGIEHKHFIAVCGALLFCVAPHIAEVIVWEPSFHFLQGLLLILCILNLAQSYLHTAQSRYAWLAGILYLLSSFSLEIFYITPWLLLSMALFYKYSNLQPQLYFKEVMRYMFLPQLFIFGLHLVLFRMVYGGWVAHIGSFAITPELGFGKPAKHLFNILFLGRFWTDNWRQSIYAFCDSTIGMIIFYGIVAVVSGYILMSFKRFTVKGKVAALLYVWVLITLALLVPLWFQNTVLVVYDRYTYFTNAFLYVWVAVLLSYISVAYLRLVILGLYTVLNLRFSIQVSRYWMKSEKIINSLLHTFSHTTQKTVLLLNLPQNMQGIPMIGSGKISEFKLMHNGLLTTEKINTDVYDVMAYNMLTPDDGANVIVINDSTLKVTLNQWGTWWWYEMRGGNSYKNKDYKLDLKDPGHWYELTLKHPADQYMLLYGVGNQWKAVDMRKKEVEQK